MSKSVVKRNSCTTTFWYQIDVKTVVCNTLQTNTLYLSVIGLWGLLAYLKIRRKLAFVSKSVSTRYSKWCSCHRWLFPRANGQKSLMFKCNSLSLLKGKWFFFLQKFWLKMNTGFSKELGGVFKKVINY